jgi:diketogulonate reductase-like aldo/keto reductase
MPHDQSPLDYERKFSEFLHLIRTTQEDVILIHHPEVLGDTYEELVESLNRLADAGKKLVIVPRHERGQ